MLRILRTRLHNKLALGFILVLLVPASVTSAHNIRRSTAALIETTRLDRTRVGAVEAGAVQSMLESAVADILLLGQAPQLRRFVNTQAEGNEARAAGLQNGVERAFEAFLTNSDGLYTGACLLDSFGAETTCVVMRDGAPLVASRDELRPRLSEPFFLNAVQLTAIPGRRAPVYISGVKLETAEGPDGRERPAVPHAPFIRYSTMIQADHGTIAGVLVVKASLSPITAALAKSSDMRTTYLVDADGSFLYGPRPEQLFGAQLGTGITLKTERPRDALRILNQPTSAMFGSPDRPTSLIISTRIHPPGQGTIQWTVIDEQPLDAILQPVRETQIVIVTTTTAALIVAIILSLFFTRSVVAPVRQLAEAAEAVSRGTWDAPLPKTNTGDEIGQLALAFEQMSKQLSATYSSLEQSLREVESSRRQLAERAEALDASREGLKRAHDELELRVEQRTREVREAQKRLLDAAHQAGMAEIATSVLHNVGNALNSVNVSTSLLSGRIEASRLSTLEQAAAMLRAHERDLATFLTTDERGKRLPAFLTKLAEHAAFEREAMRRDVEVLAKSVEHIRSIVSVQQAYARATGVVESVALPSLLEDALSMNAPELGRHDIEIVREYAESPPVLVDKHKVLQILVNLVSNAKNAVVDAAEAHAVAHPRIVLRFEAPGDGRVRLEVRDNGAGIAEENRTRIFQYGFTTRKSGHGFGLHWSALTAKEMGGSLSIHSDGPGKGATFTLELPAADRVA